MSIRFFSLILNFLLLLPFTAWSQLVIQISTIPVNTPDNSDIYIAGNFNEWAPDNTSYILAENGQQVLEIELDLSPGTYEFKFTRGSWATVEGTAEGHYRPNRVVVYNGGLQEESLSIAGWEDIGTGNSTAAANVAVVSESFYMPQLNRNRKIWIYLPPDYSTSNRDYPVMYMHDGQNLFDNATSAFGEWEVDESLNQLFSEGDNGIIIVGIENGGIDRLPEYTPWPNPEYGGGEGAAYVDFIVETLKPHIDTEYRTLDDQPNTGIMGSSLGGLISLYAGIRHQEIFGKVGVLSPSLWFTDDIYDFVSNTGKQENLKIAMLGGQNESSTMVAHLEGMYDVLRAAGFSEEEISLHIHADGQHSEWYWRREFPGTYQWLFQTISAVEGSPTIEGLSYWPNPAKDYLHLDGLPQNTGEWQAMFYDTSGQLVRVSVVDHDQLHVADLPVGSYFVLVHNKLFDWAIVHFQKVR